MGLDAGEAGFAFGVIGWDAKSRLPVREVTKKEDSCTQTGGRYRSQRCHGVNAMAR